MYSFCRSAGGTAGIESHPGRGTRVTMLLPCSSTAMPQHTTPEQAPPVAGVVTEGASILIVEDNVALRTLACNVLEQSGHRISAVPSVDEAIAMLERETFDLMFSDVMLDGGASGLDLLEWVTAQRPALRVVLTSGIPLGDEKLRPGVRFVQKPYRVAELLSVVSEVLASAHQCGGWESSASTSTAMSENT